jgi:endo-1,4-beta-xylanase
LLGYLYTPYWFFAGCDPHPAACLPQVRLRLHDYIGRVMRHFGGGIYAWDVAMEVINPDPNSTDPYRTDSPWYQTYARAKAAGAAVQPWDYIADAFRYAGEARRSLGLTSADMKLMISEYDTELPGKRANLLRVIRDLRAKGVPIEGVGHQFHLRVDSEVGEVINALVAVENLGGLVNHVTELDVNLYPSPETCEKSAAGCIADYGASPPQSVLSDEARLYRALYAAFRRPSVQSVTTWGLNDGHTWYNFVPGSRSNYPLLFDADGQPKSAFWAVVDPGFAIP